jgi:hypothetical protein
MKRRVAAILLAIVALAASPTYAQVTAGVKIGVNFADISIEDDEGEQDNIDKRTGLAVGAFVDVPLSPMFSFQPEFLYSQKGAKFEDFDEEVTIKYDVIQIPLLAKFNFGVQDAPVRGFIVAGPAFSFATKRELDAEDDLFDEDLDDEVESFDFSGVIGAGVQFGMATVELRYDHGFRNLDSEDLADIKSRTFSILFGIGFSR